MRGASWVAVLVSALAFLTACSGLDISAVPTEAGSSFVCDGVQARGAELTLGGPVEAERTEGAWSGDGRFNCAVVRQAGGGGTIMVTSMPVSQAGTWGGNEVAIVATLADQADAEPIEAGARGSGFVYADGSAGWVCDGRFTLVILDDVATEGRDARADATALAVSMLPWGCGAISAPASTASE